MEKFYFESFLIAFSAFVGALSSYLFAWTIEKSKMDGTRKLVFLIVMFILAIVLIAFVLFVIISLIRII